MSLGDELRDAYAKRDADIAAEAARRAEYAREAQEHEAVAAAAAKLARVLLDPVRPFRFDRRIIRVQDEQAVMESGRFPWSQQVRRVISPPVILGSWSLSSSWGGLHNYGNGPQDAYAARYSGYDLAEDGGVYQLSDRVMLAQPLLPSGTPTFPPDYSVRADRLELWQMTRPLLTNYLLPLAVRAQVDPSLLD